MAFSVKHIILVPKKSYLGETIEIYELCETWVSFLFQMFYFMTQIHQGKSLFYKIFSKDKRLNSNMTTNTDLFLSVLIVCFDALVNNFSVIHVCFLD